MSRRSLDFHPLIVSKGQLKRLVCVWTLSHERGVEMEVKQEEAGDKACQWDWLQRIQMWKEERQPPVEAQSITARELWRAPWGIKTYLFKSQSCYWLFGRLCSTRVCLDPSSLCVPPFTFESLGVCVCLLSCFLKFPINRETAGSRATENHCYKVCCGHLLEGRWHGPYSTKG